jgi:hypothetical protein
MESLLDGISAVREAICSHRVSVFNESTAMVMLMCMMCPGE